MSAWAAFHTVGGSACCTSGDTFSKADDFVSDDEDDDEDEDEDADALPAVLVANRSIAYLAKAATSK